MNLGQLALLLRGKYLVDVQSVTKVEGMAFLAEEVEGIIDSALDGTLGEKETRKGQVRPAGGGHHRRSMTYSGRRDWRGSERMTDLIGSDLGLSPRG